MNSKTINLTFYNYSDPTDTFCLTVYSYKLKDYTCEKRGCCNPCAYVETDEMEGIYFRCHHHIDLDYDENPYTVLRPVLKREDAPKEICRAVQTCGSTEMLKYLRTQAKVLKNMEF